MMILCDVLILEKLAEENDLDKNILLAINSTKYFNDKLALQ